MDLVDFLMLPLMFWLSLGIQAGGVLMAYRKKIDEWRPGRIIREYGIMIACGPLAYREVDRRMDLSVANRTERG